LSNGEENLGTLLAVPSSKPKMVESWLLDLAKALIILLLKTDDQGVKQWEKTLGRGTAGGGQQTLDGGFAITGSNNYDEVVLLKTDVQGNEEWRKNFGFEGSGNSIQQTADGGYIFTGSIQKSWDGFIFKTDSRGDIDLDLDELGLLPIMSD